MSNWLTLTDQPNPARTEQSNCSFHKFLSEICEGTKILLNLLKDTKLGHVPASRLHGFPKEVMIPDLQKSFINDNHISPDINLTVDMTLTSISTRHSLIIFSMRVEKTYNDNGFRNLSNYFLCMRVAIGRSPSIILSPCILHEYIVLTNLTAPHLKQLGLIHIHLK